ncbi:NUDIX hydrolase [Escherichia coli]|uniref:NUDIX hydrolase n=1 Tax=Escherichia coli TaxID=562 RepID=UPI000B9402CD|nr:NUDIX domain-containing protein [Escherichia coli]
MPESTTIHIAAAIITDKQNRLLLVRKRGTVYFMQPGGKPEPGEDAQSALLRELKEELELDLSPDILMPLGELTCPAANEPGYLLHTCLFQIKGQVGTVRPAAEIEEVRWLSPSEIPSTPLAPLTVNEVIPRVWPEV